MRGFGLTHQQIGLLITNPATGRPLSEDLVKTAFADELANGDALVQSTVVGNLYKIATGKTPQAAQAAIFWTKARYGWRASESVDHRFPDGPPVTNTATGVMVVPGSMTPAEWVRQQMAANAQKKAPKAS